MELVNILILVFFLFNKKNITAKLIVKLTGKLQEVLNEHHNSNAIKNKRKTVIPY